MATSAFIIYTDAEGKLRGTEIHHMGGYVPEKLKERFKGDFEALIAFLEVGSVRGGYNYPTDTMTFFEEVISSPRDISEPAEYCDYVFHLTEDFIFTPVRVETVTTHKLVKL